MLTRHRLVSRVLYCLIALQFSLRLSSSAFAQVAPAPVEVPTLKVNWTRDLAITGSSAAVLIGTTIFQSKLAPKDCRWCATNHFDKGIRYSLKWENKKLAHTLSDISGYAVVPLVAGGLNALSTYRNHNGTEAAKDVLIIAEAVSITGVIYRITALSVGRERPFASVMTQAEKDAKTDWTRNQSFFSGHTSMAFAGAVAGGMVASRRDSRYETAIWTFGLLGAAATGYLRIAADKHWTTDVLTGAVVGSAIGYLVPRLHYGKSGASIAASSQQGITMAFLAGRF